ncbi:MAG: OmpA family protein [Pseudorhodoplanes sp.]|jgi:outer membrane protein OmpA-like peptidoglycan-associated protein|nr:OmpA family protein [Pseudorhodoplanes sp.]
MVRMLLWSALLAASFGLTSSASAQMSKDDIVKSLKPAQGLTRSLTRTRKIEVIPGKEAEVLDQNKDLPKINLAIEFEYNSDRPTPAGMQQLGVLGDALSDPSLKSFRFMLAGHTDARGSDSYNQGLSERRALAVQRFLARSAQIEPARLSTVGFGRTRLLPNINPDDPRNRRVEVVNLLN